MSRGDVTSGGWGRRAFQRLVLPGVLALLFLAALCTAPSTIARAETAAATAAEAVWACSGGVDDAGPHTRIRTHHAVPRCPEGEGFAEHNRRKLPVGGAAGKPKSAGLPHVAVEAPPRAFEFATVPEAGRRVAGNVPHSYDPQGPPSRTV